MKKLFGLVVALLLFAPCGAKSAILTAEVLRLLVVSTDMHQSFLKNSDTLKWKCGQLNGKAVYKMNHNNVIIAYEDKTDNWYHIIAHTELPVVAFALYVDDARVVRANTVVMEACEKVVVPEGAQQKDPITKVEVFDVDDLMAIWQKKEGKN